MKILFADDEVSLQEVMRVELVDMGHTVTVCPDGTTALAALQRDTFDCLLVDLDMPGANGLEVVAAAKELNPDTDAVLMTGYATMETAIEALQQGVAEYLKKPCKLADIDGVLKKIAARRELRNQYLAATKELQRLRGGGASGLEKEAKTTIVGTSPVMMHVDRLINKLAPSDATVVILGETGTGKELVARSIHERSRRCEKPFVAINCGALPESLIESELFGHRKGSFTGADEHRTGLFQVASGGTLFLDEIGELPKGVQAKLLRFLESGEVRKIGENSPTICDVRVVCATLRNLEAMVREGTFREDLWFRINTFEITLPPLRDRIDDLNALLLYFVRRTQGLRHNNARLEEIFSNEVLDLFRQYRWPGNVRQLANIVEHALILTDSLPVQPTSLPPIITANAVSSAVSVVPFPSASTVPTTLRDLEARAIDDALTRCHGNKSQAATELGISLKTLYNKLNQQHQDDKQTA